VAKNVSSQIAKLEEELQKLRAQEVEALQEKLKTAREQVRDLEAQIAAKTGNAAITGKRRRTSPAEMRSRIFDVLAKNPKGLSQKQVSDKTGLNYVSVAVFLNKHQGEIKSTGKRKQKRYFLKG
jgi:hypothetical protein